MVFCPRCNEDVEAEDNDADGFTCCTRCGGVLEDLAFSNEVQFVKGAGGETAAAGRVVRFDSSGRTRMGGGGRGMYSSMDSQERTELRGKEEIKRLTDALQIPQRNDSIEAALRIYKLALQHNFTRGRKVEQVAAASLYIVCRIDNKPFMLIDFADALQINVFVLGAVYLQLAELLRLMDQPFFTRPVDPSLYIDRFARKLGFAAKTKEVVHTAMQLVASMKRDWMQTGRRPSGICGAALFIASYIHEMPRNRREVIAVVHIGDVTLSKRLVEFASTEAADLLAIEFNQQAKSIQAEQDKTVQLLEAAEPSTNNLSACDHVVQQTSPHFHKGMCMECYKEFLDATGGLYAGKDPPAFTKGRKRAEECARNAMLALSYNKEDEEDLEAEMDAALSTLELGPLTKALPPSERVLALPAPSTTQPHDLADDSDSPQLPHPTPDNDQQPCTSGYRRGPSRMDLLPHEHTLRAWLATRVAFEGGTFASNAQLLASFRVHCEEHGVCVPGLMANNPANDIRFASYLAGLVQQIGARFGVEAAQTSRGVQRGFANVLLREAPVTLAAAELEMYLAEAVDGEGEGEVGDGEAAREVRGDDENHAETSALEDGATGEPCASDGDTDQDGAQGGRAVNGAALTLTSETGALIPVQNAPEEMEDDEERRLIEAEGDDDEREVLSDLEDDEIDMYIHTEEEAKFREAFWIEMNKDYLELQAAKQAALDAAAKVDAENGVAEGEGTDEPKRKRKKYERKDLSGSTAEEAAMKMIEHKKLSSKINYKALEDLFKPDKSDELEATAPASGVVEALSEHKAWLERERQEEEERQRRALEEEMRGGNDGDWMGQGIKSNRLASLKDLTGFQPRTLRSVRFQQL